MDPYQFDVQELAHLAQALVSAESPNPPGDVTRPMNVAIGYLQQNGIPYIELTKDPQREKLNLVARVVGARPGPRVILNAHLDVFPGGRSTSAGRPAGQDQAGPLSRIVGRGAVDMKSGAAAFMTIMKHFSTRTESLCGEITLCLVSDEETFGPYGSRALLEFFPSLAGDYLLSTEPSSASVVRYGERGFCWVEVTFAGPGGHGAYPSAKPSPIDTAGAFIAALRERWPEARNTSGSIGQDVLAPKGHSFVNDISLSLGMIQGGDKVNMKPTDCTISLDFRIPVGQCVDDVLVPLRALVQAHDGEIGYVNSGEPNQSDSTGPLFQAMSAAVAAETGQTPALAVGLGCTDARLWRYLGVPAAVYGPDPSTMAFSEEWLDVDQLETITRVHMRTIYDITKTPVQAAAAG
ncbi:M20/M25/M40 family metallo-hydrolase [Castellaniella sp.]|uniref:M20/M25/M40 family metallo-hydrolase n=1 Tax=Castellaniella sp. TaxID=1955812 RepID=UPI00355D61DF